MRGCSNVTRGTVRMPGRHAGQSSGPRSRWCDPTCSRLEKEGLPDLASWAQLS